MHFSIPLVLNAWNSFETVKDLIQVLLIGALNELLSGKRKAKSEIEGYHSFVSDNSFVVDNKYAGSSS